MNIVFVIFSLESGGMENYLFRFIKRYNTQFTDIYIWCKNGTGGILEDEYLSIPNVRIIKVKLPLFSLNFKYYNAFLNQHKIDIVCDFTGNYAGLVMYNSAKANVKNRIVFYRRSSNAFGDHLLKLLYNKLLNVLNKRYATSVLANSVAGMKFFCGRGWDKKPNYKVIYNDVPSEKFAYCDDNLLGKFGIPEDAFVVGHTGRFNPAKNHKTILEVAERLINKYDDVYFILCGNGVKTKLKSTLCDKGIDNRVLLFENRNDIPEFLNSMDCFYFPSLTEGQPNSLIEAMMMGVPIVASNIEAIKETVHRSYQSYLIEPLSIELAVTKIEEIKANKNRNNDFTELRNLTIKKYGQGSNFDELLKILKN